MLSSVRPGIAPGLTILACQRFPPPGRGTPFFSAPLAALAGQRGVTKRLQKYQKYVNVSLGAEASWR